MSWERLPTIAKALGVLCSEDIFTDAPECAHRVAEARSLARRAVSEALTLLRAGHQTEEGHWQWFFDGTLYVWHGPGRSIAICERRKAVRWAEEQYHTLRLARMAVHRMAGVL